MRPEAVNLAERHARPARRQTPRGRSGPVNKSVSEMDRSGVIKWFDEERKFGFIIPDEGGAEIFLHRGVVHKYGVLERDLQRDVPVRFTADPAQTGRRPEATSIALV